MLNVFPNGEAACGHFSANKSSDSHITQLVSETALFPSHLSCPTTAVYKTSGSSDGREGGMKGDEEGALEGLRSCGGRGKTNYGFIRHEGSRLIKFI